MMPSRIAMLGWSGRTSEKVAAWLGDNGFELARCPDLGALRDLSGTFELVLLHECQTLAPQLPLLEAYLRLGLRQPVIVMARCLDPEQVITAASMGAHDVIIEPYDQQHILEVVQRALQTWGGCALGDAERMPCPTVLGGSTQMHEVFRKLGVAAANDLSVLLTGETGVGKDVAASCLHRHSRRADGPFVAINCTAVPDGLLESEFFGHVRGAFTSAVSDSEGKVARANGGCLLLDEIGDMPLAFQAKLLRFLEDKSYYRIGDSVQRSADVRIIASTNRDLHEEIRAGRFRSDLYYRLAQMPIFIPPLRERKEDISALIRAFIADANLDLELSVTGLTPQVEKLAEEYPWPGNVRELKNVIWQAVVGTRAGLIHHLPLLNAAKGSKTIDNKEGTDKLMDNLQDVVREAVARGEIKALLSQFEQLTLSTMLQALDGNRSRMSVELGVSRNTLRAKLREHGLQ